MAVLGLLAEGRTNREIGEALGMRLDGAKWHVGEIMAKLGVASREEAAEWWRQRRRVGVRVSRAFAAVSLRWVAAGAGAVVAGGLVVLAVVALGGGEDATPASVATEEATATPRDEPTDVPLTAEEILHRSEEAMGEVVRVRVESQSLRLPDGQSSEIRVLEHAFDEIRQLRVTGCPRWKASPSFTNRISGSFRYVPDMQADGPDRAGLQAPEVFELLGEQEISGEDAWVIRYAYSIWNDWEAALIEATEWVAKDDYRLLRREREIAYSLGSRQQVVEMFLRYDEPASQECPAAPLSAAGDLQPLTTPRLAPPPAPARSDQPDS